MAFTGVEKLTMTSVSIVGAGAWGTALALAINKAGPKVTLVAQDAQEASDLQKDRECFRLPGIKIPKEIDIAHSLQEAGRADIILMAVPAQVMREVTEKLASFLEGDKYIVLCSKGIELNSGLLMSEIVEETLEGHSISVLSGPTFAKDVAADKPCAASLANTELSTARWLASSLGSPHFRLYPTNDLVGVELTGALKNVIAIAAGIATARGYGESARAGLVTRGVAEMVRLGDAMGAQQETFLGLSGLGDLVLCCTSDSSRNMTLGLKVGQGTTLEDKTLLTEGAYTSQAVITLAEELDVDLPICTCVHRILHEGANIEDEVKQLLSRPMKSE